MKFKFDDRKVLLSHVLLANMNLAMQVVDTEEWKEEIHGDGIVEVKLLFNGVEYDAQLLENKLHAWVDTIEQDMKEKYSPEGMESYIEQEIERRIKERADNVLDHLDRLQQVLQDSASLIKPYWEK